MSKKRFSEGLDSLFMDSAAEATATVSVVESGTGAARFGERKTHGKNFVSDLDALLQEAMDESFERYEARQQAAPGKSKTSSTPTAARPLSGLDALIRQTIDVREITTDDMGKKRLTVAVDKPKLDKLKTIARMENAFLKDILVNLIDGYITEYTQRKGVDF